MRSYLPGYLVQAPSEIPALFDLLEAGWRPLAGGTDLMVLLNAGSLPHPRLAGLWKIQGLREIRLEPERLSIGAMARYSDLLESPLIRESFPMLAASAGVTGGIANQNRGTLGGNIGNASPAGDSLPVLLAYDAELELISRQGARRIPYSSFHQGYKRMDLQPGELISRILLPIRPGGWHDCFRKVGTRAAMAIAKVTMAASAQVSQGRILDFHLAYASVAPVPLRCYQTEEALRGASLQSLPPLPDETSPIDDLRASARYRRRVARNLLLRFLADLA